MGSRKAVQLVLLYREGAGDQLTHAQLGILRTTSGITVKVTPQADAGCSFSWSSPTRQQQASGTSRSRTLKGSMPGDASSHRQLTSGEATLQLCASESPGPVCQLSSRDCPGQSLLHQVCRCISRNRSPPKRCT